MAERRFLLTPAGQRHADRHDAIMAAINSPPPTPAARLLFDAMWREVKT